MTCDKCEKYIQGLLKQNSTLLNENANLQEKYQRLSGEIEDLTKSLFEEANRMVSEECKLRVKVENDNARMYDIYFNSIKSDGDGDANNMEVVKCMRRVARSIGSLTSE